MLMKENSIKLKIIKTQSSFQNFSNLSNCLFSLNVFDYSKTSFSKSCQERGEGWGRVVQEHESPKKKL